MQNLLGFNVHTTEETPMSRQKAKQSRQNQQSLSGRKSFLPLAIVVVLVIVAAVVWMTKNEEQAPATTKPVSTRQPNRTILQSLVGKWVRPDGGYVILIRSVYQNGTVDAEYLNPRSIHVSRAEASGGDDTARLFIELSDVGYPGSTYTLTYKRETDVLTGIYYQAVQGQDYEVLFVRSQ